MQATAEGVGSYEFITDELAISEKDQRELKNLES